jgi:hypothetical protein
MTNNRIIKRGLPGLLLAAAAIPAAAQETVTPPTITPAPAPSATPAPSPAPAPAATPSIEFAPQAPVVQTAPPPAPPPESVRNPAPEPAAERTTRRSAAPTPRAAPAVRAEVAAPAAAPVETAPEAAAPVETPAPVAAVAPADEQSAADQAAATPAPAETEEVSSGAAWAILGLALAAIVGLIAFLIMRRRKRSDSDMFDYDESVAEPEPEPEVAIAPPMVAAAPLVPETLAVVDHNAARPWIDIGLRPIRAESDGALDVEVTVSNSGEVEASDVRVSTWMLNAGSSDGEQALIEARSDAQVATVDVAAGAEQAVDTRVNLPEGTSSPLLVAEARYPLPSGGEGRIAATFEIAVGDETPEARLHDVIERA